MTLTGASETSTCLDEGEPLPPSTDLAAEAEAPVEDIYRDKRPRLLRFLSRRVARDEVEDVAQDGFVRVLSKQAEPGSRFWNLEPYLFRVTRGLILERSETLQARAAHVPVDTAELRAPDQIAALEARDMLNRLEALMQRLPARTREIFLAHRIDGYSYREIASLTGISVKGVEKHMSRAIAAIDRGMRHR